MRCTGWGVYGRTLSAPNLSLQSSIFDKVMDSLGDLTITDVKFNLPDMKQVNLGAKVGDMARGKLEKPVAPRLSDPTFSAPSVSLDSVTYQAAQSISFGFNSPVLSNVTYREGKEHLSVPDAAPSPAPLDYPTEDLIDTPEAPDVEKVAVPELKYGDRPELTPIKLIEFEAIPLKPLEIDASALQDISLPDVAELDFPEFSKYEDDETLKERVVQILNGDDELTRWVGSVVQGKLYASDMRRKALLAKREMDKVYEEVAGRNYALPAGVVDARIMEIADNEMEQGYTTAQAIKKEIYESAIGVITTAIKASLDIERYHLAHYLAFARRLIATYKYNIELGKVVFNQIVELYNIQVNLVAAQVEAYNAYLQTQEAQIRTGMKSMELLDAQIMNLESQIKMYGADVETLKASARAMRGDVEQQTLPLDVYEAELRGVIANLDIVKQNIASFKQAIENYSQSTDWYMDKIGSYEAAVQAEASRVNVSEANVRAYRELWSAENTRMSAYKTYLDETFRVADGELSAFRAASSAQRSYLSSAAQVLGDSLSVAEAYQQHVSRKASVLRAYNSANTGYVEGSDRSKMAEAQLEMTQQILDNSAKVEAGRILAAQEGIRVRAAGALSQAGASIKQVSLNAAGAVSESVSGTFRASSQESFNKSRRFSRVCSEETNAARG